MKSKYKGGDKVNVRFAFSQEELESALNGIDAGILLVDSTGCIAFANQKAALLLSCAGQEIAGRGFGEFMRHVADLHAVGHNEFARWIDLVEGTSPAGQDLRFDCQVEYLDRNQKRTLKFVAAPVGPPQQSRLKTVVTIKGVSCIDDRPEDVLYPDEPDPGWNVVSYGPHTLIEQQDIDTETILSKEMRVIFRISQGMRKLLDLDDLLNHILYIVSTEMRYTDCSILLSDEGGQNLVLSAGLGMSQKVLGLKVPRGTGISWWVMEHGQPQNVPDVRVDDRYYQGTPDVASELHVPLEVRGKRLGVLVVQKAEKYGFTPTDVKLLMAVAGHIASALEVAQLHRQVKKAAETDNLTGLYNRSSIVSALERFIQDAKHNKHPECISIILLDVDRLKLVNDNFGHLAGDLVLMHVAESLTRGFGANDIVGRFGGDEFIVLLPGVSPKVACERVKAVIRGWLDATLTDPSGRHVPIPSASFGISCYPMDGVESRLLVAAADNKLLAAKAKTHERIHRSQQNTFQGTGYSFSS